MVDPNLSKAVQLHDQAVNGDKEATGKAFELFQAAHLAHPEDPVIQAYYGSSMALMGRDAIDQNERFSLGMRGVKLLDQAVGRAPDNVTVRTLRAYVCYRLPETYFHRTTSAVEDFRHLASLHDRDRNLIPDGFYWQILYDWGKAYQTLGRKAEAKETWKRLLSVTREAKYRKLLRDEGVMDVPFDPLATGGGRSKSKYSGREPKVDPELAEGIRWHDLALADDPEAAKRAYELLSGLSKERPGDVLAEAYCASALSLVGKYSSDSSLMFGNAIKAMMTLDQLVARHPDDVKLRLLRANQSYRLPEPFFRRTATAIGDFEYLLSLGEKRPDGLSSTLLHQLRYDLGVCYERLGMIPEAEAAWSRLLAQKPGPALRSLAETRLSGQQTVVRTKPVSWTDGRQLVAEGIRLHQLGVEGNPEAAKLANQLLSRAHQLDPQDPLVQAWYGSSVALLGRYATDPSEMFAKAVEGLVLLKKAANQGFGDRRIRLLKAYLCYSLPDVFFHLLPEAIRDFNLVKWGYEQGDRTISEETYRQVLHDLGCALKRAGRPDLAERVWKRLEAVSAQPKGKSSLTA